MSEVPGAPSNQLNLDKKGASPPTIPELDPAPPPTRLELLMADLTNASQEESTLNEWISKLDTLLNNPPDQQAEGYDSRLDRVDYYGYLVNLHIVPSRKDITDATTLDGRVARCKNLVDLFQTRPRKVSGGGAGGEGDVRIYRYADGRKVAVKRYRPDTLTNVKSFFPEHTAVSTLVEYLLHPNQEGHKIDGALSAIRQYINREGGRIHGAVNEVQVRAALEKHLSLLGRSSERRVLVDIFNFRVPHDGLGNISFYPPVERGAQWSDLVLNMYGQPAFLDMAMEAIQQRTSLPDLSQEQQIQALRQWATFLHDMAEVGLINTDKPDAIINISAGGQVCVRTYDMGNVSAISVAKHDAALKHIAPTVQQELSAIKTLLQQARDNLSTSTPESKPASSTLAQDTQKLVDTIGALGFQINPQMKVVLDAVKRDLANVAQETQAADTEARIQNLDTIDGAIQEYKRKILPVDESGETSAKCLSHFLNAFHLENLCNSGKEQYGIRELGGLLESFDSGVARPFVEIIYEVVVNNQRNFAALIDRFYHLTEEANVTSVPFLQDPDLQQKWSAIRAKLGFPDTTGVSASPLPANLTPDASAVPVQGERGASAGENHGTPGTQQELALAQTQLDEAKATVTSLEAQIATLGRALGEKEAELSRLQSAIASEAQTNSQLTSQISALQAASDTTTTLQKGLVTAEAARASAEQTVAQLRQEISSLNGKIQVLSNQQDSGNTAMTELRENLSSAQVTISSQLEQITSLQKELAQLRKELASSKEKAPMQAPPAEVREPTGADQKIEPTAQDVRVKDLFKEWSAFSMVSFKLTIPSEGRPTARDEIHAAEIIAHALRAYGHRQDADLVEEYLRLLRVNEQYKALMQKQSDSINDVLTTRERQMLEGKTENASGRREGLHKVRADIDEIKAKLQKINIE